VNEEPTGLLPIGEFARRSSLSISALRFYGDCGVLIPDYIDHVTGYRYYSRDQLSVAELVRHLRALEMPIADIQSFLTSTPAAAEVLLDQHWMRLQGRVERNRRALGAVKSLLHSKETSMSATTSLSGARLATAIRQVLPAAGELPHHDCPAAVLVELREDGVRLAATDGHRLAVRDLPSVTTGKSRVVVGQTEAKQITSIVETADQVTLDAGEGLSLWIAGKTTRVDAVCDHYPDYEAILGRVGNGTLLVKTQDLANQLAKANDMIQLSLSQQKTSANGIPVPGRYQGEDLRIAFNPNYLAEGLSAGIGPDAMLYLGGPLDPVLIRSADDGAFSWLVMPIRLKEPISH
jgi:DNA-binding transcriptional MerR regulator